MRINEIEKLFSDHGYEFLRGDFKSYYSRLNEINKSLTNDFVGDAMESIVGIKNCYGIWNIVVDDEIDVSGDRLGLDDSIHYLLTKESPKTLAGQLFMHFYSQSMELGLAQGYSFEIMRIMNGFFYEHVLNTGKELTDPIFYDEFSCMTISIIPYVYLDLSVFKNVDSLELLNLKKIYYYYTKAMKYASDIGTYEREIKEENWNIVKTLTVDNDLEMSMRVVEGRARDFYIKAERIRVNEIKIDIGSVALGVEKFIASYVDPARRNIVTAY